MRRRSGDEPPTLLELDQIRGDLHSHTTWSDGRASVEEMGRAAQERGYEYLAICDHTPAVGAVQGLTPDDVRRQARRSRRRTKRWRRSASCAGSRQTSSRAASSTFPTTSSRSWTGCSASVHGGQRMPRAEMTRRVVEALRNPYVRCLSHPTGRYINRRPENELDLERAFEVGLEEGVAFEVNGLPDRLDLSGEHVREALAAGLRIVCSTDAHSTRGLGNMPLSAPRRAAAKRRRPTCSTRGHGRDPRLGQALGLELAQEALEQAPVAFLVAQDRDHHVLGDEVLVVAELDYSGCSARWPRPRPRSRP